MELRIRIREIAQVWVRYGNRMGNVHPQERFKPTGANHVWAIDFVSGQLCDGRGAVR